MVVEVRGREARGAVGRATEPAPVIEVDGLRVAYGAREIVHGLRLDVTPGQVYGLIGPSGGGKTTVLRAVLGLLRPLAGEARLFGQPVLPLPRVLRANVGYVPQGFTLYPNLTVGENLGFVAGLYGIGWWRRRRRVRDTLALMELSDDRRKLARNLSGGMQRRLSLAAALLHEPELLVVDEPTAGIDPILRARFWDEFRAIVNTGRTVLFTTQYVNEAELCDRVALIADGHLLAEGTPTALRRAAFGGDVVDLVAPDLDWTAANALSRLPEVRRVEQAAPGRVRVLVEDGARAAPELMRALEGGGRRVEQATTAQPSFDEVFTRLVEQHG
jgi:ABC-2 type transport system ATP-binding protein